MEDEVGRKTDGGLHSKVNWPDLPDPEVLDDEEPVGEEAPVDADSGKEGASSKERRKISGLRPRSLAEIIQRLGYEETDSDGSD